MALTVDDAAAMRIGNLAEETKLPRELLTRFDEMWRERQRPFFSHVTDDGVLPLDGLRELLRSLKVSSTLLCDSVARVIAAGESAISFDTFVRGYAKLHARTLKEALPFAFAVFDLDGDGKLGQEEFSKVISANLEMQGLDGSALTRVLATPAAKDADGVTYDAFRYFASLTSETILACCGFLLHCRDFYVPLTPLGTEAEEAAEEAAANERRRKQREREHAPRGKGGDGAAGDDAPADVSDGAAPADGDGGYFADPDFLSALEQLKTTPEERAERCKAKGNEAMAHGKAGAAKAVESYSEGLDERGADAALNATLLGNRAAAHTTLKNWGKALADATAALDLDALPPGSAVKASRRGASAALQLKKLDACEEMLTRAGALLDETFIRADAGAAGGTGAACAPAAAAGAGSARANPEAAELRRIATAVAALRAEERQKALEAAAAAAREAELAKALAARGLRVGEFADARLREQCVGAASGARVWYDAELDEVHWPVLLLYPEDAQSDFIQDVAEGEALMPHLVEMFGVHAEYTPPWDTQRRYAAPRLRVYATWPDEDAPNREKAAKLRADMPLLPQLHALQPKGYEIPGVPTLHVLVDGSDYEQRFFKSRLVA